MERVLINPEVTERILIEGKNRSKSRHIIMGGLLELREGDTVSVTILN